MSKKKKGFFPKLCKLAAAVLFTPFQLKISDEGEKRPKITVRSLAASVTYTPAKDDRPADLTVAVPGVEFGNCAFKAGGGTYTADGGKVKAKVQHICADKLRNLAKKVEETAEKVETSAFGSDAKAAESAADADGLAADESVSEEPEEEGKDEEKDIDADDIF